MSPVISLLIPCSDFRPEAIYSSLYQRIGAIERSEEQNSLYFSLLTGILPGDGFAADCVLRHSSLLLRERLSDFGRSGPDSEHILDLGRPPLRYDFTPEAIYSRRSPIASRQSFKVGLTAHLYLWPVV